MGSVIYRSALEYWAKHNGTKPPAPDIAYIVNDYHGRQIFTWSDVMQKRREWHAELLYRKREWFVRRLRAVRIHVRYFDQDLYGGWHTYIDGVGFSHWLRGGPDDELMKRFPVSLFKDEWMPAFALTYKRGIFHRKPRGVAYCWALCEGHGPHTSIRELL